MNINEIAELAGVSRATVSRYLNGGYVSAEKKERIRQVVQETGYKPSAQAQMLRTKKTRLFAENHVDGIILIGTIFTKEHQALLKEIKVPVVMLGQRLSGYSSVYYDDYEAAKELTERLLDTGKPMGCIGVTQKDEAAGAARYRGFLAALEERGVAIRKDAVLESPFTMEGGYQAMRELYQNWPDTGAVFCATDNIAIGAMTYLHDIGKRVPQDVSLTGIGDSAMAKAVRPKLTTVHYHYRTSGIEAANMLMETLQSGKAVRKELKMGYDVINREYGKP